MSYQRGSGGNDLAGVEVAGRWGSRRDTKKLVSLFVFLSRMFPILRRTSVSIKERTKASEHLYYTLLGPTSDLVNLNSLNRKFLFWSITPRRRLFQASPSKDQTWFYSPSRSSVPPAAIRLTETNDIVGPVWSTQDIREPWLLALAHCSGC